MYPGLKRYQDKERKRHVQLYKVLEHPEMLMVVIELAKNSAVSKEVGYVLSSEADRI